MRVQKIEFGDIVIDNKEYRHHDILILLDESEPVEKSHNPEPKHFEKLISMNPEVIIVGTGFSGYVAISEKIKKAIEKAGTELVLMKTPEALKRCQEFIRRGKRICAYIHITC